MIASDRTIVPGSDAGLLLLEEIAVELHRYGTPSHRLEGVLIEIGARLGFEVAVFCVPTMITIAIGRGPAQRSVMLRVEPGAPDLGHMSGLLGTLNQLRDGTLRAEDAIEEVRRVASLRCGPPGFAVALAVGGAAFSAARLFGGGWAEMIAAGCVGTATGAVVGITGRERSRAPLGDFLAGAVAVVGSAIASRVVPLDRSAVALASLIVLVPGLALTTAMNELANRHLVSGTARVLGAVMGLVALGFGAAVGDRISSSLREPSVAATPAPEWTLIIALVVAALSIAALFRARLIDVPFVALGTITGYFGGLFGHWALGPQLGACIGAVIVALLGNGVARLRPVPAALTLLPGLLLLVPGTIAFRGLQNLMQHDIVGGLGVATAALTITGAIVAGLLVANVLLPAPRGL